MLIPPEPGGPGSPGLSWSRMGVEVQLWWVKQPDVEEEVKVLA